MSSWARLLRSIGAAMLAVALAQPAVAWRDGADSEPCASHATHGTQTPAAAHDDNGLDGGGCEGAVPAPSCTASDCAGTCAALPAVASVLPGRAADVFVAPAVPPGRLGVAAPPETPPPIA